MKHLKVSLDSQYNVVVRLLSQLSFRSISSDLCDSKFTWCFLKIILRFILFTIQTYVRNLSLDWSGSAKCYLEEFEFDVGFSIACLSQLLKDFYLLGRGEVFRSLIENSKDLLKVPPTTNTGNSKYIINSLFSRV